MAHYLLVLEESSGGNDFITQSIIDAENRQKVKYHFHRTLKDLGWHDSQFGKHCLSGPRGMFTEISEIREVNEKEHEVLQKHLTRWTKV